MKCDELKEEQWLDYYGEPMPCYSKATVDAAIEELKAAHHKERHEYIEMVAQLRRENEELKGQVNGFKNRANLWEYNALNEHNAAVEVRIENAKLKAKLAEKDSENRRLKRALWLARAELCHRLDVDRYLRKHRNSWYNENCLTWAEACVAMEVKMCKAESKCRSKAEEYK